MLKYSTCHKYAAAPIDTGLLYAHTFIEFSVFGKTMVLQLPVLVIALLVVPPLKSIKLLQPAIGAFVGIFVGTRVGDLLG